MVSSQWYFADFRLDPDNARLWRGADVIALTPKAFDVLHYLVRHADRLVTKDALLEAVWPETTVTEVVVRIAIGAVRKALGETAQTPRYIATVSRRGYRFLAPVTEAPSPEAPQPPAASAQRVPLADTPTALAEQIRTSRAPLTGERKQITVLFADIKDSMPLIRDLDPEAAQQLLDPALHAMMDAVHRYEGTVNQVLGDGIMALFGAPSAHEDHAARACYAALAMQAALGAYADEVRRAHGLTMQSRIGLNSGEVVVRTIRNDLHMDYSAVGQTTHLAARLEQAALPDTILLTDATVRLVAGLVRVKAWGPMAIKGLAEPIAVWELVGAHGMRRRLQTARARGLTHFVGRQTERTMLQAALAQAGAGHGQVVAVVGEAGVGKSRLVDECVQDADTQGWLVLDSAAVSYGQATPYFPVFDLLRRYCHLEEGEETRTIQRKVTDQVLALDPTLQDALPALLGLLDALPADSPCLQLDAPQRRQHTFTALKLLLLRESQRQPVLLVVEDLHWLDTETQTLLASLIESLPTARLLLLVTYRPDYRHGWGSKTYYTQLRLDPLLRPSADAFLRALLGADPSLSPLASLLIQRTEGNPFFLEESVRTLIETEVLVGEPGAYRLASVLPTIQVPATVQAVLAARIDRLPSEEKHLMQTAAVIGMEVPLTLLQVVGELPDEAFRRSLTHLQDAEFLYEASLFPELVYTFKHALTQEVTYGSLLHAQRRVLHARIVEALEALAPDRVAEHVERLAHHALRGEVWDKAVTYCQQAGTRANGRAAFREAGAFFEQALQALASPPGPGDTGVLAIELRLALGDALNALGAYARRLALLGEAAVLARALDDRARLGRVLVQMAHVLRITGDTDGAVVVGRQALELAAALGERALQEQASHRLGQIYYASGDFGRTAALLRWNVEAADREAGTPRTDVQRQSQAWLAPTLSTLGAFAEGRRHGEEALRLAALEGRGVTPIIAHGCLGHVYLAHGDLAQAIWVLEQGLALCRTSGNLDWLRAIMASLGYAYALQGRLAEGRALLEEAMREGVHTGALGHLACWGTWLSEACRLAGHGEEAGQHARQALGLAQQQQARGDEARALHQLGVVHAHADPPNMAPAEAYYQQALALAEALGMRPLQAHCHRGLGMLYAATGQHEQARIALSMAIEMYRGMAMTFWLPETEAALAQVEEQ